MINILHTIDTAGTGGAETVFLNIVKGLERNAYHSIAAIPGRGWIHDELVREGIAPVFFSSRGSFSARYLFQILSTIKRHKIDIIQSHLIGSNVYCSLAGLLSRVPVICSFHGFVDIATHDRLSILRFFLINHGSTRVVFVSNHLRDYYVNTYRIDKRKAVTIYNGIDIENYQGQRCTNLRNELGLDENSVLIGSVGNIRESKGYEHLLRAAAIVIKKHPHCRFVIAGEGSGDLYKHLRTQQSRLGLDNKVIFLGYRPDVHEILKNIDLFVLPSISEGFSIVTLEAMACRVPIVATKSGGPQEILANDSGILVQPGNHEELAMAISIMLEDNDVRYACVQHAADIVQKNFSRKFMIDEYTRLYQSVLNNKLC